MLLTSPANFTRQTVNYTATTPLPSCVLNVRRPVGACWLWSESSRPAGRRGPSPCRITNSQKEVYQAVGKEADDGRVENREVDLPGGGRGVLAQHVTRPSLEAFSDDTVDLVETDYWFSPPEMGYAKAEASMEPLPEDPDPQLDDLFPQPYHPPDDYIVLASEENPCVKEFNERIPLAYFCSDDAQVVMTGVVTDMWYYHGLQVDIGGEYDGLVPISEEDWDAMAEDEKEGDNAFYPGMVVKVKVNAVLRPGLARWPLILRLMEPELASLVMDPDEYHHPVNHAWAYSNGWTLEDILAATGRTYEPLPVYMRNNDSEPAWEMQDLMGAGNPEYYDAPRTQAMQYDMDGMLGSRIDAEAERYAEERGGEMDEEDLERGVDQETAFAFPRIGF